MGIIYILENKIDGKCYVGQTTQLFAIRFGRHKRSKSYFGNALRKYGVDNFNKILIENIPEEQLDELEKKYIQKHNSIYPNGYNLMDGGCKNKHHNEETRKKLSRILTGKATWNKGIPQTEEAKQKIGEANKGNIPWNKGIPQTEEVRRKNIEGHKGQVAWNKGISLAEEHKKHLSEAKKGKKRKPFTEETKKKMSEAQKGEKNSNFGKHQTEEHQRKIQETKKKKRLARKN